MIQDRNQKIVVLTGASRGIGHATVKKFASENWRVITCSRQPFDDRCPWPGGERNHIQLDLSNSIGVGGLNTYYSLDKIAEYPYARVNNPFFKRSLADD